MTTVVTRASTPPVSASLINANHPALPPLITSPPPRRATLHRPPSYATRNRLSQYSNTSTFSRSRPVSTVFPMFHSSLPYTNVRDFGYPAHTPMHYGPAPEASTPASGKSTPISEHKRYSDPPTAWDSTGAWRPGRWEGEVLINDEEPPPAHFGDGPPWSEDEDLQSPVVVSSRHRKHSKSHSNGRGQQHGHGGGSPAYPTEWTERSDIIRNANESHDAYGYRGQNHSGNFGGSRLSYASHNAGHARHGAMHGESPFGGPLTDRSYIDAGPDALYESDSSLDASPSRHGDDESRYSRDYQFTIASPDEEMHGKAVALFDFERENENELPLIEGQIIWVSYRHGQGWLVAEDPKTQESGLVPEEYVRLLRDIQGGLNSLTGQLNNSDSQMLSPVGGDNSGTPTQAEHNDSFGSHAHGHAAHPSTASSNGYQQPVVSVFSTSSKDLQPLPREMLGKEGVSPPQVLHYHGQRGGSQVATPTVGMSPLVDRDREHGPGSDGSGSPVLAALSMRIDEDQDAKAKSPSSTSLESTDASMDPPPEEPREIPGGDSLKEDGDQALHES